MITCITCTGDRHVAFDLCKTWMEAQTLKPTKWIVVDDGDRSCEHLVTNASYIRRIKTSPEKGHESLANNLLMAIPHVPEGSYILFIEDDDYYDPKYIEMMFLLFQRGKIVGQTDAIYYNIQHRWWMQHKNRKHASLCQTGIAYEYLPILEDICKTAPEFIDIDLWRRCNDKHLDQEMQKRCIGIKGMPGRTGIGSGHRPIKQIGQSDYHYSKFINLLGKDALEYFYALNIHAEPLSVPVEMQAFEQDACGNYIITRMPSCKDKLKNVGNNLYELQQEPRKHYLDEMEGRYKDQTCYVVGKGVSLEHLDESYFRDGPILAINEAIHTVNDLLLTNPQFAIQQDDNLKDGCWNKRGAMILSGQNLETLYVDHPYVIRQTVHLPQASACFAVDIAKFWHCSEMVFFCLDSYVNGCTDYAKAIGYKSDRFGDPNRFLSQHKDLIRKLGDMPYHFVCPETRSPNP